jgi:hypothetical protein
MNEVKEVNKLISFIQSNNKFTFQFILKSLEIAERDIKKKRDKNILHRLHNSREKNLILLIINRIIQRQ